MLTIKYSMQTNGIRAQQYVDGQISGASVYSTDGELVWRSKSDLCPWDCSMDDEIARVVKGFAPIPSYTAYLRFKDIPKSGKSRDYASGETLAGVSVYELDWDFSAGEWVLGGGASPFQYILNRQRGDVPAYIVTGERVGTGPDGEPLLANTKIIGSAAKTENGWALGGKK
jgi:hypothetical protein